MTPKAPSPRTLPPLSEVPPAPADPSSENPKVERRMTQRGNWLVPELKAADDSFEDAAEAALYRACFWPLHVWKRETGKARELQNQVTTRLSDGMARVHCFRTWRGLSQQRRAHRKADKKVAARVRRDNLARTFRRLAVHMLHLRKVAEVESSEIYIQLRAKRVGSTPFLAWLVYSTCHALVRRRCYGELLVRTERMVHPLPCAPPPCPPPYPHAVACNRGACGGPFTVPLFVFTLMCARACVCACRIPPEWEATPRIGAYVTRSATKDVHSRTVNRHRRKRLAPLLFDRCV